MKKKIGIIKIVITLLIFFTLPLFILFFGDHSMSVKNQILGGVGLVIYAPIDLFGSYFIINTNPGPITGDILRILVLVSQSAWILFLADLCEKFLKFIFRKISKNK